MMTVIYEFVHVIVCVACSVYWEVAVDLLGPRHQAAPDVLDVDGKVVQFLLQDLHRLLRVVAKPTDDVDCGNGAR